jgi:hypothetical protein
MITDEQGQEWVLRKLYDDGWKYYVKNVGNTLFVTTKRPVMDDDILDVNSGGHIKCINNISKIMPQIERNEVLNIAEELGIVDWSKVKVDTPVLVRDFEGAKWEKRYFAFFKNGSVNTWCGGTTSWSSENITGTISWRHAKVVEV